MNAHTIDRREELIEACKRGERVAQKKLYEDYCNAMYNICVRMINNRDDAADALQNAFIKVFKNIGKFQYQSTMNALIIIELRRYNLRISKIMIAPRK